MNVDPVYSEQQRNFTEHITEHRIPKWCNHWMTNSKVMESLNVEFHVIPTSKEFEKPIPFQKKYVGIEEHDVQYNVPLTPKSAVPAVYSISVSSIV